MSLHGSAADLELQTRRAVDLELEKKRAKEEAERLDKEKQATKEAMLALAKQAEDQQKSREHLVGHASPTWVESRRDSVRFLNKGW